MSSCKAYVFLLVVTNKLKDLKKSFCFFLQYKKLNFKNWGKLNGTFKEITLAQTWFLVVHRLLCDTCDYMLL
jgi:hypothetical protein